MCVRNQLSFPSSVLLLLAACIKLTGAENDLPVVQRCFCRRACTSATPASARCNPLMRPPGSGIPIAIRCRSGACEFFSSGWRQPVLLRFRQGFTAASARLRIHVSADERFELFSTGIASRAVRTVPTSSTGAMPPMICAALRASTGSKRWLGASVLINPWRNCRGAAVSC